jgi:hypothetical protein
MINDIQEFIDNTKGIIVDTNLFLLYPAGLHDLSTIKKVKSTKNFSEKSFDFLHNILGNYEQIITTPHILTEFSNLNKDKYNKENYYRKKLFEVLQFLLENRYLLKNSLIFLN